MQNTYAQDTLHQLTSTILDIARLPAAPTTDWSTIASGTFSSILPNATIGVIVAFHNRSTNTLDIESTGTSCPSCTTTNKDDARCALERISAHPVAFPRLQADSLYISPISRLIPQWFGTKASLPWTSPQNNTLAALGVIHQPLASSSHETPVRDLVLLTIAKPANDKNINIQAFSAAFASLLNKAQTALIPSSAYHDSIPWLTLREQVILNHLIDGRSVREIAEIVDRSQHTVHDHVKNLHKKLDATSRGQLIARAMGLTDSAIPIKLATTMIDEQLPHREQPVYGIAEYKSPHHTISRQSTA